MKPEIRTSIMLCLTETGGEMSPEIKQELDDVSISDWSKADDLVDLIREAETDHARLKAASDVAGLKTRIASRRVDALKTYLLERMEAQGLDRRQGARFDVRVMDSPVSIRWASTEPIPEPFQRIKIELDSAKAKAAYSLGGLPKGFEVTRGRHLRIEG